MENKSIVDRVKGLVSSLLEEKGIELVEIDYRQLGRQMVLRLFVDKAGGITLEECAALNGEIGPILDKDDTITTRYILEVSSPGLDRPLQTKRDFTRSIGKEIGVFLKNPLNNKLQYTGRLKSVEENSIILENSSEVINIPLDLVNKGKLKIDFSR